MISKFYRVAILIMVLAGFQTAFAQYSNRVVAVEPENVTVLNNNGDFRTGATSESGVAAPNGFVWSESPHDTGDLTVSNSVSGYGASFPGLRLADNFTVPQGQVWRISSVKVWGFVQNWTAPVSPFSGGVLQIWDGVPSESGSNVVFGDLTTDRLLSSTPSNAYATFNSVAPAPDNTPNTSRFLWENKLSVAPTLTLGPGTYWIDFGTTVSNAVRAQFFRNVISPGNRTQAGWNARQFSGSTGTWAALDDGGNPSSAPDVPQDIAFEVGGTVAGGNNASKFADYDGDGKQDFSVARVDTVTGAATLYTLQSGDGNAVITPLPYPFQYIVTGDYDGDGKTDVATIKTSVLDMLWTIKRSSDGVTENIRAGTYATDAPVQGDYDGDGKTEIAVFRKTGTGAAGRGSFWVRKADGTYTVTPWGNELDYSIATLRAY